ncbi:MAG: DUF4468 domain-containing protein [Sphingobacteriaceae bacterium]|nr:MAG: DUF4468 domain-containing protein [Sphingobacteriaceae bacterium]
MKKLFAPALLLFALTAHAQAPAAYTALPKDSASQKVTYTAVVPVAGVSKDDLFTRAKEWSARNFGDNKAAERMNDRAAGTLIAECELKQPPLSFTDTHSNLYRFTLAVYTKEGKYMYRLDDITYQNVNPALATKDVLHRVPFESYATVKENKRVAATLTDFNKRIDVIINSLNQAMTAGAKAVPKGW